MINIIKSIYVYCTDFVLNVAHLMGYSYYEINAFLFCYLFPSVLAFLIMANVYLSYKIRVQKTVK